MNLRCTYLYFFAGQLWRYNKDTMLLESKKGNWKYLPQRWTQLPQHNETGPNLAAYIEEANRTVLGLKNGSKTVELQIRDESSSSQKWLKSKTMNGYFILEAKGTKKFLTVINSSNLVIQGKYFKLLIVLHKLGEITEQFALKTLRVCQF